MLPCNLRGGQLLSQIQAHRSLHYLAWLKSGVQVFQYRVFRTIRGNELPKRIRREIGAEIRTSSPSSPLPTDHLKPDCFECSVAAFYNLAYPCTEVIATKVDESLQALRLGTCVHFTQKVKCKPGPDTAPELVIIAHGNVQ